MLSSNLPVLDVHVLVHFQSPTCTSAWWKGDQPRQRLPGEAMPSVVKALAKVPPRASREVDRLTRNSENSWPTQEAGAGGRTRPTCLWVLKHQVSLNKRKCDDDDTTWLTGFLTQPGEEWSPNGTGPRNFSRMRRWRHPVKTSLSANTWWKRKEEERRSPPYAVSVDGCQCWSD